MLNLFLFEFKKLTKNKVVWLLVFLCMLVSLGLYAFHSLKAQAIRQQVLNQYEQQINYQLESAENWFLEEEQANEEDDQALIEEAKMMGALALERHQEWIKLKADYRKGAFEQIYNSQLNDLEWIVESPEYGVYEIEGQEISSFTLQTTYAEKQYLIDHGIQPFEQNTIYQQFLQTEYDELTGRSQEVWDLLTQRYSSKGVYYLYNIVKMLYLPSVFLVGCFIFGNTFTSEWRKKTLAIRFHRVLPINEVNLFFAKILSGYCAALFFTIVMVGIPIIVAMIVSSFGQLDYPVLVYELPNQTLEFASINDAFHFIPLNTYLRQTILLALASSLFIYALYNVCSLFGKEPIITTIMTVIICYLGMNFAHSLNPFSYLDTNRILTQLIHLETHSAAFNYRRGIWLSIVFALLLLYFCYVVIKQKLGRRRK
ncbi:ABC-2 type transport system permease protein [Amphibacillus marinus]|uniref:ABC-2 type transport system permease protein n=1 Tax=Amphibacillus marinus TaxID=872970 RepID=A0A1H8KGV3_9BACI|nr:hypothetical protein [Amphibacillus marinus]SEN92047.1 ABC-2 type transport system permease protein [Amphibacillus marinus]